MLSGEQRADFDRDGYLNYGRVMSDEAADEMCQRLFAVMDGRGEGVPTNIGGWGSELKVIQIVNIWEADSLFRAHLYNPTILDVVSELTNSDTLRVWHDHQAERRRRSSALFIAHRSMDLPRRSARSERNVGFLGPRHQRRRFGRGGFGLDHGSKRPRIPLERRHRHG